MTAPLTHLGELPVAVFLADYWQRRPLLVRQALPGFTSPLDGDELAGLALETDVESRIVLERAGGRPWQVQHGPFAEADFQTLPPTHWTLLVQAVDHWVPQVSELLEHFRFLPDWRLDDIMVSYAADGGSVGPHYDFYDVFLLQGAGRRRWRLGQVCDDDSARLADTELNILADFRERDEWLLEPGDMLYLPPRLAHWGVAEGDDCITYSVGFRAPSHADILGEFCQDIALALGESYRYSDPGLEPAANPGEISAAAVAQVQSILQSYVSQPQKIAAWFGRFMTSPKYGEEAFHTDALELDSDNPALADDPKTAKNSDANTWLAVLRDPDSVIDRHPTSRFAFHKRGDDTWLFVDGGALPCPADLAQYLCAQRRLDPTALAAFCDDPAARRLLEHLLHHRKLVSDEED